VALGATVAIGAAVGGGALGSFLPHDTNASARTKLKKGRIFFSAIELNNDQTQIKAMC
jgi:hypothetical protein